MTALIDTHAAGHTQTVSSMFGINLPLSFVFFQEIGYYRYI